MKFNFKKILSLILALALAAAFALSLTGCSFIKDKLGLAFGGGDDDGNDASGGDPERSDFIDGLGGVSETFEGAVSEKTYTTSKKAAEAYIANEVVGESDAEIISTTEKGELSKLEIARLGIPDELKKGMKSVTEIEVEYEIEEETAGLGRIQTVASSDKGTLNKTKKITVYIIKFDDGWRYFSPLPVTGETVNKSYFESVFNAESYKNCTLESKTSMEATVEQVYNGKTTAYSMTATGWQTCKFDDGKILFEYEAETVVTEGSRSETMQDYKAAYIEEVDGEILCYVKTSKTGDWYEADLKTIGFSKLEELAPFADQYLDYTYFTKTDYGFELNEENAEKYIAQALDLSELSAYMGSAGMDIDMYAEYYVAGGVLSGMRMDLDMSMEVSQSGVSVSMAEEATCITTCTDYGTTVVEKPFED